jgi:Fur family transcriptional regulator, ferric uptake regulator
MSMQRETSQRKAIRRALTAAGRPLGPNEILDSARDTVPGLGIATVYRNVKALLEEGWIVAVELPGEPARYEIAGKDHHHHFLCRACDSVFEIEGCPGNIRAVTPDGFQLERHEVVLYGLCTTCT